MLENISEVLDFQGWMDWIVKAFFLVVKWPLIFWNGLPWWVRGIVYTLIVLFAAFIGWILWKYRDEIGYRAF